MTVPASLLRVFKAAVDAADPYRAVLATPLPDGPVTVIGAGKAAARMARAAYEALGDRIEEGLVVVKDGYDADAGPRIRVVEGGHPLPTPAGERAAEETLRMAGNASGTVVLLLSGGGSALLPAPAPPVTLGDKIETTRLLLACGADIHEMNCVRKHLSRIKGGQLARVLCGRMLVLVVSDVVGNDLSAIASGPATPDPTTCAEALAALDRYGLRDRVPRTVVERLLHGEETPKPGDPAFRRVEHRILADHSTALRAAVESARLEGWDAISLSASLGSEARELGQKLARIARDARRPAVLIGAGETVVTVRGDGRGGRCSEFALAAAIGLADVDGAFVAGLATDGTDGTGGSAGAWADSTTCARARSLGMDPEDFLSRNDSLSLFERLGDAVVTGPTLTNVGDLYIAGKL